MKEIANFCSNKWDLWIGGQSQGMDEIGMETVIRKGFCSINNDFVDFFIYIMIDTMIEYASQSGLSKRSPPGLYRGAPVQCTLTAPRRPIRGQEIYDNQSQSAMGGRPGTMYPHGPGQWGYIVPGQPRYNVPYCPGCKGTLYRGSPGTIRGAIVLIAPTVKWSVTQIYINI